jgi:hypothetical protein
MARTRSRSSSSERGRTGALRYGRMCEVRPLVRSPYESRRLRRHHRPDLKTMYRSPIALLTVLLAWVTIVAACDAPTATLQQDFPVIVDDVDVPESIFTTDPLQVRVMGVIGDSDCFSLLRVEVLWTEERDEVVIVPWARFESGTRTCQAQQVLLNEEVVLDPPFQEGELGVHVPADAEGNTVRYTVTVLAPDAEPEAD